MPEENQTPTGADECKALLQSIKDELTSIRELLGGS